MFTSFLLNVQLAEVYTLLPSAPSHTPRREILITSQGKVGFKFLSAVVTLELERIPKCPPFQGPIYFKRLSCLTAGSSQRIINSFCKLKCHLWPCSPACGKEEECGVMDDFFAFLVEDIVVICLHHSCRSSLPDLYSSVKAEIYGSR